MTTCPVDPPTEPADVSAHPSPVNSGGQADLQALIKSLSPPSPGDDRRHDRRYPFSQLITLLPVEGDDASRCGEPIVVVGKNISQRGLNFYHPKAMPHRKVIAVLETPATGRIALLLDLKWCRFTRQGWYESGGRILRVVEKDKWPKNKAPARIMN
jgi:hypothetical protein